MTARRVGAIALLGALVLSPSAAAAADDFTLPFYAPTIEFGYGVDRDPRIGYQLDWTGQLWADAVPHYGRVYDQHAGIDYPMATGTVVAAARSGTVVDTEEQHPSTPGNFGNFVRLRHGDGRETVYYHLAYNGALVGVGQAVTAGQAIGRSGCSGNCNGPHLHFQLLRPSGTGWANVDPMADRLWTTWPGRVPFLAAYYRESNASTVVIKRQATVTHWVEFRNSGGRTWLRDSAAGRSVLATWSPVGRISGFRASDWPSGSVPTWLDPASVPPDGIGRFTFGLRAAVSPGSYSEAFNLKADLLAWFDWNRLGGYYIPIVVTSNQVE